MLNQVAIVLSALMFLTSSLHLKQDNSFMSIYLDNDGLDNLAEEIVSKYPNNSYINSCKQDRDIKYMHLGPNQTSYAIIMCNIHARQAITAEICLNWVQSYLGSSSPNISIDLFYLANRQRDNSVKNNSCVRKSKSGVDLNRNFPTEFNYYKASKSSEIYSGPKPFSEPITKCLRSVIEKNKPLLFLDIHSGQNGGLFYQQGYNSRQDRMIFDKLNQVICNGKCRVTTLARDGEAINGHIFADLKVRKQMKYSLLIESYGSNFNFETSCLKMFNPQTQQQKNQTIQFWTKGINLIINQFRSRENI